MLIFDNHLHLRREGRFLEAMKDFKNAGGTHCVLCQYPMPQLVLQQKSYLPAYQITKEMAEQIRQELNIGVFITVGPYPVDYLSFIEKLGRSGAYSLMKQGIDEAVQYCVERDAIAIGEIGRPHFPVDDELLREANALLCYAMQQAKDSDIPLVLHTEHTTPEQCHEFATMAKKIGYPVDHLIKHFSPPLITPEENYGLLPSVLARTKNIQTALQKGTRFLMETDYIDDPKRPGAVLGPKTVPKLTKKLLQNEIMTEKQAYQIHRKLPSKIYNITLEE